MNKLKKILKPIGIILVIIFIICFFYDRWSVKELTPIYPEIKSKADVKLGEAVTLDGYKLTIDKITKKRDRMEVFYTFENTNYSEEELYIDFIDFHMVSDKGSLYMIPDIYYQDSFEGAKKGESKQGKVAFKFPFDCKEATISYGSSPLLRIVVDVENY